MVLHCKSKGERRAYKLLVKKKSGFKLKFGKIIPAGRSPQVNVFFSILGGLAVLLQVLTERAQDTHTCQNVIVEVSCFGNGGHEDYGDVQTLLGGMSAAQAYRITSRPKKATSPRPPKAHHTPVNEKPTNADTQVSPPISQS